LAGRREHGIRVIRRRTPLSQRISPSNRAHLEFFVTTVEQQRACVLDDAGVERILTELESEDEWIRARAVRQVCPCRVPWPLFYRLRKAAARLKRDPSPLVRANALHVELDARTVRDREATMERLRVREERRGEAGRARR